MHQLMKQNLNPSNLVCWTTSMNDIHHIMIVLTHTNDIYGIENHEFCVSPSFLETFVGIGIVVVLFLWSVGYHHSSGRPSPAISSTKTFRSNMMVFLNPKYLQIVNQRDLREIKL